MKGERISEERLNEYLAFSVDEEDDEMVAILTEIKERRRQAGYNRDERLNFLLRFVKDAMPEVARDLRSIYEEMGNDIYYSREHMRQWQRMYDELKGKTLDEIAAREESEYRETLPPEAQ